jgi:hypothetical protein
MIDSSPDPVETALNLMFPEDPDVARAVLPSRSPAQPEESYLVKLLLLLKISEGSLNRLQYFVDRDRARPGDVWTLGRLPEPLHRLTAKRRRQLGLGPVFVTEPGPRRMAQPDDLWLRQETNTFGHCIVCGSVVSKSGSLLPTVFLSREGPGGKGRSSIRVWVHYPCKVEGQRMAADQGYGWSDP